MFCPCLEIFIQDRADPVLVPGNCYFAIIRGDCRRHAAKIGQSIIVDPDPVPDIAFGHSFSVKVITVGEGSDKDRDLCGLIRVPAVMQIELLLYISEELTIPHGQSDHLSRRFRSLISERDSR